MAEAKEEKVSNLHDEFEGLNQEQIAALKKKRRQQARRRAQRRSALHTWALENRPRMSNCSTGTLMPSDWGIQNKHKDDPIMFERLQQFNQYTRQHWQFSPITGKLELIK